MTKKNWQKKMTELFVEQNWQKKNKKKTDRTFCGRELTVLFVFVEPFVAVFRQEFVGAKGSIDEAINKRGGKILPGGVHLTRPKGRSILQVRLVDVFGGLGFDDIQLKIWNRSLLNNVIEKQLNSSLFNCHRRKPGKKEIINRDI